jgi:hypothetical protein
LSVESDALKLFNFETIYQYEHSKAAQNMKQSLGCLLYYSEKIGDHTAITLIKIIIAFSKTQFNISKNRLSHTYHGAKWFMCRKYIATKRP